MSATSSSKERGKNVHDQLVCLVQKNVFSSAHVLMFRFQRREHSRNPGLYAVVDGVLQCSEQQPGNIFRSGFNDDEHEMCG